MKKILVAAFLLMSLSHHCWAEDENTVLKEYKNNTYNILVKYPDGWYTKENGSNPDKFYLFVMKEKVEGKEPFNTGFTLAKIYDVKKNMAAFKSYVPKDVAAEFLQRYISYLTNTKSIVIAFACSPIMLWKDECYITELYFTDNYGKDIGVFLVSGFKNNTYAGLTLSAPREKFKDYRNLYLKILKEANVF